MSFEGFYQILCKNGHLHEADVYLHDMGGFDDKDWNCPHCKEPEAWRRLVDQTNDDGLSGLIPLTELKKPVYKDCDLGHKHIVEPAVYAIPDGDKEPTYHSAVAYVRVRLDLLVMDGLNDEDAMQRAVQEADYEFEFNSDAVSIEGTEIVDLELMDVK